MSEYSEDSNKSDYSSDEELFTDTNTESDIDAETETESLTNINNETELTENNEDDTINELYYESETTEVIVNDKDRITLPRLSKYERTRILSERTRQIAEGAKVLIRTNKKISPYELALLELKHNVLPFKVIRKRPDNKIEIWKLNELTRES